MKPLRAIIDTRILPPVLYNKIDSLIEMEKALQHRRLENQLVTLSHQLRFTNLRLNEDILNQLLLREDENDAHRPDMHTLWFHEQGLGSHAHVLSHMPSHQLIPVISLIASDFERGRIDSTQVDDLYCALNDVCVGQSSAVKRELANAAIRCHALDGNVERAFAVIHDMRANKLRRNHVTYAPLFRLARKNKDIDLDIDLRRLIRDVEGGRMNKWIWIDCARLMHVILVFIRFNWVAISYTMITIAGAIFIHYMIVWGLI